MLGFPAVAVVRKTTPVRLVIAVTVGLRTYDPLPFALVGGLPPPPPSGRIRSDSRGMAVALPPSNLPRVMLLFL